MYCSTARRQSSCRAAQPPARAETVAPSWLPTPTGAALAHQDCCLRPETKLCWFVAVFPAKHTRPLALT